LLLVSCSKNTVTGIDAKSDTPCDTRADEGTFAADLPIADDAVGYTDENLTGFDALAPVNDSEVTDADEPCDAAGDGEFELDAETPGDATGDQNQCEPYDVPASYPTWHKVPIGAEDLTFYVGPYVMHTTQTSVTIVWESKEIGNTRVEYGRTNDYGNQAEAKSGTMHEVVLNCLAPSTIYHYRACTDDRCTGDLTFSTAPVPGQKFRFAVYGDSRSAPDIHRSVVDNIIQDQPVLVFNVGDIVDSGKRLEYKEQYFDPVR